MDYKESLLLPNTKFPMRGNLPQNEPKKYKLWDEQKVYNRMKKNRDIEYSIKKAKKLMRKVMAYKGSIIPKKKTIKV